MIQLINFRKNETLYIPSSIRSSKLSLIILFLNSTMSFLATDEDDKAHIHRPNVKLAVIDNNEVESGMWKYIYGKT